MIYIIIILLILFNSILFSNAKFGSNLSSILFYIVAVIAGLRFQTGDDWAGYESYFDSIAINENIINSYLDYSHAMQFEPGYFILAYLTKNNGFSYISINLISCILLTFSLIKVIKKFNGNISNFLIIFIGLPYIILMFNQVRQALALSFIFLGIAYYKRSYLKEIIFYLIALLFHYVSILFIAIICLVRVNEIMWKKISYVAILMAPIIYLAKYLGVFNPYTILYAITPSSLHFKIEMYGEEATEIGIARYGVIAFFGVLSFIFINKLYSMESEIKLLIKIAITGSIFILYSVMFFPNSYSFFGRILIFSMICYSIILSDFKFFVGNINILKKCRLILALISLTYYFLTIINYSDVYLPYRSIFYNV
jgi:hypothetical protein